MDSFFSIAELLQILFLWELGKNIVPFSVFVRYISNPTKQESEISDGKGKYFMGAFVWVLFPFTPWIQAAT